ncbi:MAG: hypothetical protein KatS3mg076_0034 [Candidatus Binatia bacterium]|nr:MAG: hypothetical protein KatS3mg076_0034 [Candidatus Binatia bacterium]
MKAEFFRSPSRTRFSCASLARPVLASEGHAPSWPCPPCPPGATECTRRRATLCRGHVRSWHRRSSRARSLRPQSYAAAVFTPAPGRDGARPSEWPRSIGGTRSVGSVLVPGTGRDHVYDRARPRTPRTRRSASLPVGKATRRIRLPCTREYRQSPTTGGRDGMHASEGHALSWPCSFVAPPVTAGTKPPSSIVRGGRVHPRPRTRRRASGGCIRKAYTLRGVSNVRPEGHALSWPCSFVAPPVIAGTKPPTSIVRGGRVHPRPRTRRSASLRRPFAQRTGGPRSVVAIVGKRTGGRCRRPIGTSARAAGTRRSASLRRV